MALSGAEPATAPLKSLRSGHPGSCTIRPMSVPDRRESAALLLSLEPPAWHLRHARAVAETAAWLALQAVSAGRPLDRRLAESAALLHDVDKLASVKPEVDGLPHGEGSADWLTRHGGTSTIKTAARTALQLYRSWLAKNQKKVEAQLALFDLASEEV